MITAIISQSPGRQATQNSYYLNAAGSVSARNTARTNFRPTCQKLAFPLGDALDTARPPCARCFNPFQFQCALCNKIEYPKPMK